jgi:lysyl-tRNA synthetase class 2
MIQAIRGFFTQRGYLEVETPLLIPAPAPERHILPIPVQDRFLHTSPELCMKRLLSAGYTKIFQVTRCFRGRERGDLHLPEFTLLEWYRAEIDYKALMDECEDLLMWVSRTLKMDDRIHWQGCEIDLKGPWERIRLDDAFDRFASMSLRAALESGDFDEGMVREVEPNLGQTRPSILYDYPASMASLARLVPGNKDLAERFEVYLCGIELANGFSELTDEGEQRARFKNELARLQHSGIKDLPMPEEFLKSLARMPEASGIALGIDRLAMIFADTRRVDDVVTFTPEEL